MSTERYGLAVALTLVVAGCCGHSARRLRGRHLPELTGVIAAVAEVVIAVAVLLAVSQLAGLAGVLGAPVAVGGCVAVWAWTLARCPAGERADTEAGPRHAAGPVGVVAVVAVALVLGHWATAVGQALHGGMLGNDTLSYHGPIAATFARLGSIVHPLAVYQDPAVPSYPDNSELLHAVGILLFSRDVLSPLLNLGWLGLAAAAGWCWGGGGATAGLGAVATAALVDLPALSMSQPGSADNDVMALALLAAALAILFASRQPAALLVAALALGMGLGTKLTLLVPVAASSLAVLATARAWRGRALWVVGVVAGCEVWYVRNLLAFGSPIPSVRLGIGPIGFPAAQLPHSTRVVDLLGHPLFMHRMLAAGLSAALTAAWPGLLVVALGGAGVIALSRRSPLDRALGAAALLAALAYLFTPRTADGGGGLFAFNLRYLVPALVLGTAVVVRAIATLAPGRARLGGVALGLAGAGILLGLDLEKGPRFGSTSLAVAGGSLAVAAVAFAVVRTRPTTYAALALPAAIVAAIALWPAQRTYLLTRYVAPGPFACEEIPCTPLHFADRRPDLRIAVAGGLGPYLLYGPDLSNTVTAVLHHGPNGSWLPIQTCGEFLSALNRGRYSYAVVSPAEYVLPGSTTAQAFAWLRADAGAHELAAAPALFGGDVTVFALSAPADPRACARRVG